MDKKLVKAKSIMVNILKDVDLICKEHDIDYWIDFGTLLGAVRHKGFIPWDDDIDITMPRKHYNKFIEVAQNELSDKYFVQLKKTDSSYKRDWLKIRDKNSLFLEYGSKEKMNNGKNGIFIDVFPLDRIKKRDRILFSILRQLYQINPFKGQFGNPLNQIMHILLCPLYLFRRLFFKFSSLLNNKNGTLAIYGVEAWFFHSFHYDDIYPLKELQFEGSYFNVPNKYKKHLTEYYGDYMELPPVENRHSHAKIIEFFVSSKNNNGF